MTQYAALIWTVVVQLLGGAFMCGMYVRAQRDNERRIDEVTKANRETQGTCAIHGERIARVETKLGITQPLVNV